MQNFETIQNVTLLYETAFNRAPDKPGLFFWADQIDSGKMTLAQVVNQFLTLPGELSKIETDNAAFVTEIYQNLLGRAPDAGGLQFWTNLASTPEGRVQAVLGILTSTEAETTNLNGVLRVIEAVTKGTSIDSNVELNNAPVVTTVEVIKEVPGPTVYVDVPGPTVIVDRPVPGPTVVVAPASVTTESVGGVSGTFTKSGVPGTDILPGTGIPGAANYVTEVDSTYNTSMILAVHPRGDVPMTPTETTPDFYTWNGTAGPQVGNAARSFHNVIFGVDSGDDGIRTGEFRLGLDKDPSAAKDMLWVSIKENGPGNYTWVDAAGNVRVTDGDGTRVGVSIDSTNFAFFPEIVKGPGGAGDLLAGNYAIELEHVSVTGVTMSSIQGELIVA